MAVLLPLLAALNGLLGVAVGAFGAHAVQDPQAKAWIATGATYGLVHAVAALALAGQSSAAAWCWTVGALLFAGSLYALGLGAPRGLAVLAPVGGTFMIVGWALLMVVILKRV